MLTALHELLEFESLIWLGTLRKGPEGFAEIIVQVFKRRLIEMNDDERQELIHQLFAFCPRTLQKLKLDYRNQTCASIDKYLFNIEFLSPKEYKYELQKNNRPIPANYRIISRKPGTNNQVLINKCHGAKLQMNAYLNSITDTERGKENQFSRGIANHIIFLLHIHFKC